MSSSEEEFSSGEEEDYIESKTAAVSAPSLSLKAKIPNLTVKEEMGQEQIEKADKVLLGDDVKFQFSCPHEPSLDKQVLTFKMGHTVDMIKVDLEAKFGIPFHTQRLFLEETEMPDPLSLSDLHGIKRGEVNQIVLKKK